MSGLVGDVRMTRLSDINRSGAVKTVRAVVGRDNGDVLAVSIVPGSHTIELKRSRDYSTKWPGWIHSVP